MPTPCRQSDKEAKLDLAGWGLYLHVPFCARKCPYCDFTVAVLHDRPEKAYIEAVLRELDARLDGFAEAPRTLYVGGGTPGLLAPAHVDMLAAGLRARGLLNALEEFTVEFNPEQSDLSRLAAWRAAGATRISLGVQALHPEALQILGREHRPDEARQAIERVHQMGYEHLSIDFIFAIPGVRSDKTLDDIREACTIMTVDHLSLYELTIEPRTAFGRLRRQGKMPPPPEDAMVRHWHDLVQTLEAGGFARYEVSSFARPNGQARHNAAYWTGRRYLGVGVSASSLAWQSTHPNARPTHITRRKNRLQLKAYLHDPCGDPQMEALTWKDHLGELFIMGLRTTRGVDLPALAQRFDVALPTCTQSLLHACRQGEMTTNGTGCFVPTQKGMEIAESIAYDLLLALDHDVDETL